MFALHKNGTQILLFAYIFFALVPPINFHRSGTFYFALALSSRARSFMFSSNANYTTLYTGTLMFYFCIFLIFPFAFSVFCIRVIHNYVHTRAKLDQYHLPVKEYKFAKGDDRVRELKSHCLRFFVPSYFT